MGKVKEPVEVRHLADYSVCTNFGKYNWNNLKKTAHEPFYIAARDIILSCYVDMQNLEKKVSWNTIRNRVHKNLAPLYEEEKISEYMKSAKVFLNQLRSWYLQTFRDGPTTCLVNLRVESTVPAAGLRITDEIGVVTLSEPDSVILVEITDKFKNKKQAIQDFRLRTKIWMLKKNGIEVSQIQIISIRDRKIEVWNHKFHEFDDFLYKTERVLSLTATQIKQQIHYPSISKGCETCPYRRVCSW